MLRKTLVAGLMALCGLFAADARADVLVESAPFTITGIGDTIVYDFSGDPNIGFITPTSTLIGIEAVYTFHPAPGQTGSLPVRANLSIGGDVGVGFDVTVNLSKIGGSTAYSTNYADDGLAFSDQVIDELFADPAQVVNAALSGLGPQFEVLSDFLTGPGDGGTITSVLRLITNDEPGGNGNVPEPASLLLWGAVGMGLLARRRMLAAKQAA